MNFRILHYFLTVAHEQSITKAAELLHITQPTLSRQLMQLEEDLGVRLFEREQHRLKLTTAGSFLQQRGQEIIDLVEKTSFDIQTQEYNLSGRIVVGAGEYNSVRTLARLISSFQERFPEVKFDIFTGTADVIADKMQKGLIDIAVLQAPVDTSSFAYIRLHEKEELGILMRVDSPLRALPSLRASDLAGVPLIMPTRLQIRSEVLNWLSGDLANMNFLGTCNLLANAAILVEETGCCALVIRAPLMDENRFTFRPLQPPLISDVLLAWRRDTQQSRVLQKFIEHSRSQLQHAEPLPQ